MSRSTTGQWLVESGQTLVGPFDGMHPAREFAREMRAAGVEVRLRRLWPPSKARQWRDRHTFNQEAQHG